PGRLVIFCPYESGFVEEDIAAASNYGKCDLLPAIHRQGQRASEFSRRLFSCRYDRLRYQSLELGVGQMESVLPLVIGAAITCLVIILAKILVGSGRPPGNLDQKLTRAPIIHEQNARITPVARF